MIGFTILGASGFIGSRMAGYLEQGGATVSCPRYRDAIKAGDLGHVIYCIGLTADFRFRPYDTMNAHVGLLAEILKPERFRSLLYLSSTRVYGRGLSTAENANLKVNPTASSELYNISKLAGETLCLNHDNQEVRVARLSNVFGAGPEGTRMAPDNFLASVTRNAVENGHISLRTGLESCKDYVAVEDVLHALRLIATRGKQRLYNVAAGVNVTHREITDGLSRITGCSVSVEPNPPTTTFPVIDTARLRTEFSDVDQEWHPVHVVDRLGDLVSYYRAEPLRLDGGLK